MYTSGSTGKPKGILHGHRVLAAYTPSIALFFNLSSEDEDAVFWSPSDWAWVGGLLDMLFPAWMAGRPVATSLDRFSADQAYGFMSRHRVTHTFLAPLRSSDWRRNPTRAPGTTSPSALSARVERRWPPRRSTGPNAALAWSATNSTA